MKDVDGNPTNARLLTKRLSSVLNDISDVISKEEVKITNIGPKIEILYLFSELVVRKAYTKARPTRK